MGCDEKVMGQTIEYVFVAYLKVLWNFLLESDGSHYDKVKGKAIPLKAWTGLEGP